MVVTVKVKRPTFMSVPSPIISTFMVDRPLISNGTIS